MGPCGAPGHKNLSVSPFLPSKGHVQAAVNPGRERMAETREKQSRNNSAASGQGPGSASRDTQNSVFELFCRT